MEAERSWGRVISGTAAMASTWKDTVYVVNATALSDGQRVVEVLLDKLPVIVNFTESDPKTAQRLKCYINGAAYALGASIIPVSKDVILIRP